MFVFMLKLEDVVKKTRTNLKKRDNTYQLQSPSKHRIVMDDNKPGKELERDAHAFIQLLIGSHRIQLQLLSDRHRKNALAVA